MSRFVYAVYRSGGALKYVSCLQRRFDATRANGAPADPCFKGAKQSDENKDRCENWRLRNETTTGKQKDNRGPTAGDTAFAVNVRFHPGSDAISIPRQTRLVVT